MYSNNSKTLKEISTKIYTKSKYTKISVENINTQHPKNYILNSRKWKQLWNIKKKFSNV